LKTLAPHPSGVHKTRFEGPDSMSNEPIISIVDDDSIVREAIHDLIKSLGYEALAFASAEHFLQSHRVADTSCLIADLQMPGLSGLDLQDHLLANGYHTPVILVTAFPKKESRERALRAGAVSFLSKPFEESTLISSIDIALKRDREHRAQLAGSKQHEGRT
jgi:FixJ family two-component response regulator